MRRTIIASMGDVVAVGLERFRDPALLIGLCLAGLMIPLELTMIAVALPSLERDLGFGVSRGAWVIDAYMVAFASFVLAAGALADRFGRGRVLLAGVVLFGATSALCGAAGGAWVLLIARAVQGVGAAITISAGLGVLANRFQGNVARFRAFGLFTSAIGVGMASGPTLGGALASSLGWRATFYVHAPLAMITAALVLFARSSDARATKERRFDLAGTALATASLLVIVGALIEGGSLPWVGAAALLIGCLALCVAFVKVERQADEPVFDLSLLRRPAFAGAQAAAVAYSSAFGALLVYLPRLFEIGRQDAAWSVGVAMMPLTVPALIVPLLAARFADRLAPRMWLAGGLFLAAIGGSGSAAALLGMDRGHAQWSSLSAALVLTGAGFALSNAHLTNIAMTAIPLARAGVASGMNFTVRQASVALGVAAAGRLYSLCVRGGVRLAVVEVCIAASMVSLLGAVAAWLLGPARWPDYADQVIDHPAAPEGANSPADGYADTSRSPRRLAGWRMLT